MGQGLDLRVGGPDSEVTDQSQPLQETYQILPNRLPNFCLISRLILPNLYFLA